jgi:hypothetical protein
VNRQYLAKKIQTDLEIPCYTPANGVSVTIDATHSIPVSVSRLLLKRQLTSFVVEEHSQKKQKISLLDKLPVQGLLLVSPDQPLRLLEPSEAINELGFVEHSLLFESKHKLLDRSGAEQFSPEAIYNIILSLFEALSK